MVSSEGLNKSIAALLTLEGAGFIKHPDGSHSALWQGAKLGLGDIVVTSPGSKAVIVLADGSEFEFGKAQGDAVKIDASVLDIVSDISEVRVLDLSYLYPLLNDNQLDRPSAHLDESVANLVVADGIDSGEIRDLLDDNPAPAASGDLGGGDLTSGNRYVVLESNPMAHDTNPFPTNPIPEFSSHVGQEFVAPENTPLALLMQNFSAVAPEPPTPPQPPTPLAISLTLSTVLDDDAPVTYHVNLNHAPANDLVLNPILVWANENNSTDTIILDPITTNPNQLSYDITIRLPEELDDSTVSYTLYLTVNSLDVDGVHVLPVDAPIDFNNGQTIVAVNSELSLVSDYWTEGMESIVSINWMDSDLQLSPPSSLDDEGENKPITVTVTDPAILQHVDSSPIHLDVWATYPNETPFIIAHLTSALSQASDSIDFPDGIPVIHSTDNGTDTLYFDGIPTNFGEGHYDAAFTLIVTPSGLNAPTDYFPSNLVPGGEPSSWTTMDLPLFQDTLNEKLSFTFDTDAVSVLNGFALEETHGQESQFTVTFIGGELRTPITLGIYVDSNTPETFVTFDPTITDSQFGCAVYNPGAGTYTFGYVIPDYEDGIPHKISLDFTNVNLAEAGFEELDSYQPSIEYTIYPDVNVTLLSDFASDDEGYAIATVGVDHPLLEDLVLNAEVKDSSNDSIFWSGEVIITRGEWTGEIKVPLLDESTEGKTFTVSLSYDYPSQVHFASDPTLSAEPINVDLSEVQNIAFTVPVDTVHISLTSDVSLINDEDPFANVTFTYHIDQPLLDGQSATFDVQVGGAVISSVTIDSPSLTPDVDGTWFGTFSILATSFPDGVQGLTLFPTNLVDASAAFGGMDDFVVGTVNLNVVDYSIVPDVEQGINTFVFSALDASEPNSSSGEPLHGADLIEGFDLIGGDAIQFPDAFVGAISDFDLTIPSGESTIQSLSVNDEGLVTFLNNIDGAVEINQSNLINAVDFLMQHSTGGPGLTVDFLVNNGSGIDTYVFNQGEPQSGQPTYTLVNVSNQEAAGLSLGSISSELIHIEQG